MFKVPEGYVTNRVFAKDDKIFNRACSDADIPATKRQASKWRNGRGKARAYFRANRKQYANLGGSNPQ